MEDMAQLRKEVAALTRLVQDLNRVSRDCFAQMLKNEAETKLLRTRLEIVEARITLLPPRPDAAE